MASFRKRGPHQWQAQVRKKGQPLQTKTFETRAQAEQWARAIEVEMDKGMFVSRAEAESTTLKDLLERYLAEITPLKKSAASETNRLRALMRHDLARRFVAGIRGVDIARFRDERLHNVSSATAKRDLVLLGQLFAVARKEWGINVHNPVRDIKLPAENRPRDRRLRADEEARLLAACRAARNPWLLPVVQLALETAMRQGELLRLRWTHNTLSPLSTRWASKCPGHWRHQPAPSGSISGWAEAVGAKPSSSP
jgi:integrase